METKGNDSLSDLTSKWKRHTISHKLDIRAKLIESVALHEGWEESAIAMVDEAIMPVLRKHYEGKPAIEGKPLELQTRDELLAYIRNHTEDKLDMVKQPVAHSDEVVERFENEFWARFYARGEIPLDQAISESAKLATISALSEGGNRGRCALNDESRPPASYDSMEDEKAVKNSTGQAQSGIAPEAAGLEPECSQPSSATNIYNCLIDCRYAIQNQYGSSSDEYRRLNDTIGALRNMGIAVPDDSHTNMGDASARKDEEESGQVEVHATAGNNLSPAKTDVEVVSVPLFIGHDKATRVEYLKPHGGGFYKDISDFHTTERNEP